MFVPSLILVLFSIKKLRKKQLIVLIDEKGIVFHPSEKLNYIVWGNIAEDEGTITGNIGRHIKNRLQMSVYEDESQGKHAVTHYKVIERLRYITWVECKLETGRTHQIRAHFKHIGHTLFNDERYGGNVALKGQNLPKYKQFIHNAFQILPRQALHAHSLGFTHPTTKKEMYFTSEMPKDMEDAIKKWRIYVER